MSRPPADATRRVVFPPPSAVRKLEVRGPTGRRRCRSDDGARRAFQRVLAEAAHDDKDQHGGWSLWWSDRPHLEDGVIVVWLWPQDDEGGDRSAALLTQHFEGAGFLVKREARPSWPLSLYRSPSILRDGDALAGTALFPDLHYAVDLQASVPTVERRFDFPVQTCPHCQQNVQPSRALWGMPSVAMALRLSLGEVEAMGCLVEPGNAICPRCRRAFQAIGETP